jgi:nitroreductase
MQLGLSADELLSTTRAVRKRLDFDREVAKETVEECLELALQAPTGGNAQSWAWVMVRDPEIKRKIGDHYRSFFAVYRENLENTHAAGDPRSIHWERMLESGSYLAENIHRAPWLVVPCIEGPLGRTDTGTGAFAQAMTWASIYPAVWSFMLALRERGLGSCLTTNHLAYEREVAELLGIPYERVNQAGLLPVAYTKGSAFRPAPRVELSSVTHLDRWGSSPS